MLILIIKGIRIIDSRISRNLIYSLNKLKMVPICLGEVAVRINFMTRSNQQIVVLQHTMIP